MSNDFIEKTFDGIKFEDNKEVQYSKIYRFYKAKHNEILKLESGIKDDKARGYALKRLCVKKVDGSNIIDQEFDDMDNDEVEWIEFEMLKLRCLSFPFGKLLKDALDTAKESETILSGSTPSS